jgi:hypothetical protein
MESIFRVPVLKQPKRPELTRDDRLRIQTLFFDANFIRSQIYLQTNYTYDQVCYVIQYRFTPQKYRTGRRVILNIPQRKKLIQWVTTSKENRQTPWADIFQILGWECGEKVIRTTLKKEGYARRVARKKCPLTEENRLARLAWAIQYYDWTDEQ